MAKMNIHSNGGQSSVKEKRLQHSVVTHLTLLLIFISLIPLASSSLGTFKQNDCFPIVVPSNSSTVNLTNVNTPSPNSTIIISNKAMTKTGNLFNYTFCNTTVLGVYTYGYCDNIGNCFGNEFTINGSGQEVSQSQITLIIIGLVVLLVIATFFFILSFLFRHPGTKIFLMALSTLTLIVLIGIIASNAQVYLAEFPNIVDIYSKYYIVFIALAGSAMIGLVVWFVYFTVTTFNKSRGRIPDDDD